MKGLFLCSFLAIVVNSMAPASFAFDTAHVAGRPFVPNELKSFVYYYFSLYDRNAPKEKFLEILQDDGLDMRLPEDVMKSHKDFVRWYEGKILPSIKTAVHDLRKLDVGLQADGTYRVDLEVLWTAEAVNGDHYRVLVHQVWTLVDDGGPTPKIAKLDSDVLNKE